jgi:diguanylate cyclase (GGDEF)-like protein
VSESSSFTVPEDARLRALAATGLMDTPPEREFDALAELAGIVCSTPIALVSLIDASRQWFKARVGLEASETPRSLSFCAHAIQDPGSVLVIPDATEDPRFRDNPMVVGEPHVRFYAGAPLVMRDGSAVGTLCVIDHSPRTLTEVQLTGLRSLADQVVDQIAFRASGHALEQARASYLATLDSLDEGVITISRSGEILGLNASARQMFALATEDTGTHYLLPGWTRLRANGSPLGEGEGPVSRCIATGEHIHGELMGLVAPGVPGELSPPVRWLSVNARPILRADGGYDSVVASGTDVTAQVEQTKRDRDLAEAALAQVTTEARTDVLTGVANRRGANAGVATVKPGDAIVLLDLDHFKILNDSHGHQVGDRALALFGSTLRHSCRVRDMIGRWGGEEFIIVLAGPDPRAVERILRDLRQAWDRQRDSAFPAWSTFSAGLAYCEEGETPEATLARADRALYSAKDLGRDRTELALPPENPSA